MLLPQLRHWSLLNRLIEKLTTMKDLSFLKTVLCVPSCRWLYSCVFSQSSALVIFPVLAKARSQDPERNVRRATASSLPFQTSNVLKGWLPLFNDWWLEEPNLSLALSHSLSLTHTHTHTHTVLGHHYKHRMNYSYPSIAFAVLAIIPG
ncbi:hypothetical protein ILYODFUR_018111 [Ilyodon furcidens]|uniref:Uncharacterized protein n=1 Tax=Ilyodon furcidens TaxID=33524 RepID=A0ABV0UL40_9TELE